LNQNDGNDDVIIQVLYTTLKRDDSSAGLYDIQSKNLMAVSFPFKKKKNLPKKRAHLPPSIKWVFLLGEDDQEARALGR
jgi:hypothetical protein